MKRFLATMIAGISCVTMLAGCGNSASTETVAETVNETSTTETAETTENTAGTEAVEAPAAMELMRFMMLSKRPLYLKRSLWAKTIRIWTGT